MATFQHPHHARMTAVTTIVSPRCVEIRVIHAPEPENFRFGIEATFCVEPSNNGVLLYDWDIEGEDHGVPYNTGKDAILAVLFRHGFLCTAETDHVNKTCASHMTNPAKRLTL